MQEHQVELGDSLALLDIAMLVAEELDAPRILAQMRPRKPQPGHHLASRSSWIKEGLYPPANPGLPRRLQLVSSQRLAQPAATSVEGDSVL